MRKIFLTLTIAVLVSGVSVSQTSTSRPSPSQKNLKEIAEQLHQDRFLTLIDGSPDKPFVWVFEKTYLNAYSNGRRDQEWQDLKLITQMPRPLDLCSLREWFYKVDGFYALYHKDFKSPKAYSAEELSRLESMHRQAGVAYAKTLLAVAEKPGEWQPYCGAMYLSKRTELLEEAYGALEAVKLNPSQFGITKARYRQVAVQMIRQEVALWREGKHGPFLIKRFLHDQYLTPAEVGLSDEEFKKIMRRQ